MRRLFFRQFLPFDYCFFAHNELAAYFFSSLRHLSDSSHRETYESAHSVILSIFALHAQRQQHTGKTESTNLPSGALNAERGDNKQGSEDGTVLTSISHPLREETEEESFDLAKFVKRMVPFYAQCLIEVRFFFRFCN